MGNIGGLFRHFFRQGHRFPGGFQGLRVVAKRPKDTYFLRVDGKGKLGEERNDKTMTNLPWDAMSFPLGQTRYTAVYIDSPRNPRGHSRASSQTHGS